MDGQDEQDEMLWIQPETDFFAAILYILFIPVRLMICFTF